MAYHSAEPRDLRGMLLSGALGLFLLDALVVAFMGAGLAGLLRRRATAAAIALMVIAGTLLTSPPASAQTDEANIKAVSKTRLAYVVTGNADVDSIVQAGMAGLTLFLAQRTAFEGGDPVGVDPARDELSFYPLLYWPVVSGAPRPPQETINKLDAYMKQGGTVLFDTRDAMEAPATPGGESETPGMLTLRNILGSLDIPELEPVPREHVLTKTFYLLRDFPGRFTNGQTWVEALPRENDEDDEASARPARGGDGVSPIIITSNDLAGAWPSERPANAAAIARRTAPARIRVPCRRQHRDVSPDRQLQGRPGSRAGVDRAAGTVNHAVRRLLRTARAPAGALDRAGRDRGHHRDPAVCACTRRCRPRRGAGAHPAGAGQSLLHP
jgi:hypothetical protein